MRIPMNVTTERDIARDEENYRLLAENSTDLIMRISIEGICLYVSPASVELLGYEPGALEGRYAFDFIHPLDRKSVAEALEPEILFRSHRRIECRLRRKDGYYRWFESKFQFFGDIVTRQLQIIVVARDISDRVKAERFNTVRHSIAALKTTETDLEREFSLILETICGSLSWDLGEIWLIDDKDTLIRRKSFWHGRSGRLKGFAETSSTMAFAPGVGLPGLLWSRGEASLFDYLPSLYSSVRRREYEESGLVSAIGTVLVDEAKVYGVVLFLSRRKIQRNRELLDMIAEIGSGLGSFLAKFRARERFETESEKLGLMVEEGGAQIRALQAEVARQQRLEQDILMAAEVQRSLLPTENPDIRGFEYSSAAIPARYISGDFYDHIMPSPSLCDIIIADVSGKGIPAAMMTSAARMMFRHAASPDNTPAILLAEMNESLYDDLERTEMFLTAQLIRIDTDRGSIAYASAGHTEALLCRPSTGECRRLPSTAPPIGVMRKAGIGQLELCVRPGDYLVIYSDGITEAVAAEGGGELFGMDRFIDLLGKASGLSAANIVQKVLAAIRDFSGEGSLADDLTLIVLKATPRDLQYSSPSTMDNLDPAVAFIKDACLAYGETFAEAMELVASELVTNAITHARPDEALGGTDSKDDAGAMNIHISLEHDRIILDISYPGEPFDAESLGRKLPEPLEEGGRGILIVRALVDELEYEHQGEGPANINRWHIVKIAVEENA
ncbi:MAG: hypothetical protein CVV53_00555 [Spirochaetae bacterium HGW-Spirochaetae-9]|nr:MAG: hypothetical protein CVV53_00555 [Spirochaetae bacterium HGW-Spirochaetae-9]